MEQVIAFWNAYGPIVIAVLGIVVGSLIWVARGEGKQLAKLVVDLVVNLSAQGWDSITEAEVKEIAGRVYDYAYNYAGPAWFRVIPWRLFITKELVQKWSWEAWMKLHDWYDSQLAQRVMVESRAAGTVPTSLRLVNS